MTFERHRDLSVKRQSMTRGGTNERSLTWRRLSRAARGRGRRRRRRRPTGPSCCSAELCASFAGTKTNRNQNKAWTADESEWVAVALVVVVVVAVTEVCLPMSIYECKCVCTSGEVRPAGAGCVSYTGAQKWGIRPSRPSIAAASADDIDLREYSAKVISEYGGGKMRCGTTAPHTHTHTEQNNNANHPNEQQH